MVTSSTVRMPLQIYGNIRMVGLVCARHLAGSKSVGLGSARGLGLVSMESRLITRPWACLAEGRRMDAASVPCI